MFSGHAPCAWQHEASQRSSGFNSWTQASPLIQQATGLVAEVTGHSGNGSAVASSRSKQWWWHNVVEIAASSAAKVGSGGITASSSVVCATNSDFIYFGSRK